MYSISSAFRAAINSSHQPISRATLWTRGQYVRDLPVIGGSVTVDENSSIRRRCTLTLADPLSDLVPESVTDPLWPKFNRSEERRVGKEC